MKKNKPLLTEEEIQFELMMGARDYINKKLDPKEFINFYEYVKTRFTPEELEYLKQEAKEEYEKLMKIIEKEAQEECCVCHKGITEYDTDSQYDKYSDTMYCSHKCLDTRAF